MAPKLSEDEIDDLVYLARAGEATELTELLSTLATREGVSDAEILLQARDEGKSTCMHMATGNGHLEIVKYLIGLFAKRPATERQEYLDAANEYGNTGLHWASLGGHLEVVKVLVDAGASPALANDKNYVPLDLASFNDHVKVVDYFLEQAKKLETEDGETGLGGAVEGMGVGGASGKDGEDEGEEEFVVMKAGDVGQS
ncbi:hypothetical protein MCOR27_004631 [Pyricularia oryzae]|uniref:Ankyrin n=4 Tax=Pyricularia TaxID=48558 RepID=A0ABQ8NL44_PYRGI|nr:uncharacterized protein MGG_10665 [Pyricularia oryzae 70-15]KAH8841787.1 hypothetical protein MCOR01_005743 [Pyricularia oryzae]KAI6298756.1 hypothetical protein MCOR33_005204 [Pyricularia grisea]EHA57488.1 hypothetical protein MGG_10665 [Pyricularia oryzae 70-15]KAH9434956.1 hypothetical protein MCOR02_003921 [Pyricularia oryzae]KAI6253943.1 hypothetical protein MCOR19_009510 [Pyricularia oryzae]